MTTGKSDLVTVTLEKRLTTALAIAFTEGEKDSKGEELLVWLPKSQIEVEELKGSVCEVTLPEWLANDKGLI